MFGSASSELGEIRIETMLKDPSYEFKGETFLDPNLTSWTVLEVVDDGSCQHLESICPDCADTWQLDHWVRIVSVNFPDHPLGINNVPGLHNLSDMQDEGEEENDS